MKQGLETLIDSEENLFIQRMLLRLCGQFYKKLKNDFLGDFFEKE